MKSTRSALMTAIVAVAVMAPASGLARAQESTMPADAKRLAIMVGTWKGTGSLTTEGASQPLTLTMACETAAAGWGAACALHGKGPGIELFENDLFGVDPATGKGHWYAVTNMGEAHDHVLGWNSDRDFVASYAWQQDGAKMEERITMRFATTKAVEFRSVVTANGTQVASFTGTLSQ